MQVDSTNNSPNFCAIKATSGVKKYVKENFSKRALKKFTQLIEEQQENPYNINISVKIYRPWRDGFSLLKPDCCCEYLEIIAGDKIFNDLNLFSSSIGTIKKAIKYLSKYAKIQEMEKKNYKILEKCKKDKKLNASSFCHYS